MIILTRFITEENKGQSAVSIIAAVPIESGGRLKMETKEIKSQLKDFVLREQYPDLSVFLWKYRVNSNELNRPDLAPLRELACYKMIEYLKNKQKNSTICGQDKPLTEKAESVNNSHFVYDAMKDQPRTVYIDPQRLHKWKIYRESALTVFYLVVASLLCTFLIKLLMNWI